MAHVLLNLFGAWRLFLPILPRLFHNRLGEIGQLHGIVKRFAARPIQFDTLLLLLFRDRIGLLHEYLLFAEFGDWPTARPIG